MKAKDIISTITGRNGNFVEVTGADGKKDFVPKHWIWGSIKEGTEILWRVEETEEVPELKAISAIELNLDRRVK